MTKKIWTKSPKKSSCGDASSTTPRSKSGDSVSVTVGTPSKRRRGIKVILGCRNNAHLQKDNFDDLHLNEPEENALLDLPIEYPHTDLSMSHSSSFTASSKKEESVPDTDTKQEFTIESEVRKCIQGLKDYMSSIVPPDWVSSDILLASMDKVNELTSCSTGCLPMAFGDSRSVHSDSSVIMKSKESATTIGVSRVRSWPLTSNDAYFKTAAQAQAEELKCIKAKLEDERQKHETLSLLIHDLKKEILKMSKKELELIQGNDQASVRTNLLKEKMNLQLVNHQDELQKMEARWHSENEQVISLKSEISRLAAEIVATTTKMRAMDEEVQEATKVNTIELKTKAEQLKALEDKLCSERQKSSSLQAEIEELRAKCSNANLENNTKHEKSTTPIINSDASQGTLDVTSAEMKHPRLVIETPSAELGGVEHDLLTFNATSVREKALKDDAFKSRSDVRNSMPEDGLTPASCAEEGDIVEEMKSFGSRAISSASGITSLRVNRNPSDRFKNLTQEPDDKSQSTTGSRFHFGCLQPTYWCVGTNHDATTVDDSLLASRDDLDDKHGYSTSFSKSFESTEKQSLPRQPSLSSDTSSTHSSGPESVVLPLPSDSSRLGKSRKGDYGLMNWFRTSKQAGIGNDRNVVRDRVHSTTRGMILVQ